MVEGGGAPREGPLVRRSSFSPGSPSVIECHESDGDVDTPMAKAHMKRAIPSVPPLIDALHSLCGRKLSYNFYKNTVSALVLG